MHAVTALAAAPARAVKPGSLELWYGEVFCLNRSIRITVCSMVAAVDAVLMFLTGVIPGGTLVLPALAGLPLIMVVIEFGKAWAWMAYLVVSLLSALIAADKDAVLFFILFFGSYSILKAEIEKRPSRAVRILLKLVFFNAAAIASFYLGIYLLGVPQESFTVFGVYLPWLYLLLGNIVFIIYDYAVSLLIAEYCRKIHPRLKKWLHNR
jgi:hypothetical protein